MQIFNSFYNLPQQFKQGVVVLGNFDGVHLAHQKLFEMGACLAKKAKAPLLAVSFQPHPAKVLKGEEAIKLIQTFNQKIKHLNALNIDAYLSIPFTLEFASQSANFFLEEILFHSLSCQAIVTGYDFSFGKNREGNRKTLTEFCEIKKIEYQVLEAFHLGTQLISSSQIRKHILEGKIKEANHLLGYPFELEGQVIHGASLGQKLNFPTANLQTQNELLPKPGVYACKVRRKEKLYPAACNVGFKPSVENTKKISIEAHLLNFNENLYDEKIEILFFDFLREEKKFESLEALSKQIQEDCFKVEKILYYSGGDPALPLKTPIG